ncbi:hypothetical protein ACGF0J_05550 [Nonomuraea sp. NPDC047897]|uniref:hypothetical protein n=1 Tax=Nonomuraea sp. NPDC047897 TaxID=3364346 RepID=UPI00371D7A46
MAHESKLRRAAARVLTGLIVLLMAAVAGLAWAYPSVAATTCPSCYGLTEQSPGLYVEADLPPARRAEISRIVDEASERVTDFYGGRRSSPTVLACTTEECYQRIGGGKERGIAVLNRAVMLSPRGLDPVIASHEMSHVELHQRLASGVQVPQWFDEGLAVVLSDDRRYLAPATTAESTTEAAGTASDDRCLVPPDGPLPATLDDWLRAAGKDPRTYAKAACQASRWLNANGGRTGLLTAIDRLNSGRTL